MTQVMPSLAMDAASTLIFGEGDAAIVDQITQRDASGYFATIILQAGLVSCAYQLLFLHEKIVGVLSRCLAVTDDEKAAALEPWPHECHLRVIIVIIGALK
jgi:hypothetical protein